MVKVFSYLDEPVKKALQPSPQARHHFTQADQVNQLVWASEADPDRGFMARMMALALERIGWSDAEHWVRMQGSFELAQARLRETAA